MKASSKKSDAKKMNESTALTKSAPPTSFPAIGSGKIVTIDPKALKSFEDVGLGTGLWPEDMQVSLEQLLGKEFVIVDAKIGLKGIIANKETEYGVVRCWAEKAFQILPSDAPEYEPGTKEYDEMAVTIESGTFFTTATGGVVAYRQVSAALSESLLPLRTSVWQSAAKAKGMSGYFYFGSEAKAKK